MARWGAIFSGLSGLILLLGTGSSIDWNIGDGLALLSSLCWALGAIAIRRSPDVPVSGISFSQFFFSAVFVIAIGASIHPLDVPTYQQIGQTALVLAVASIFMVLPAIYALFWASKILSPGRVGLLMMSEALVAVVTASIFLNEETLTAVQWTGAALIIGSGVLELLGHKTKRVVHS